MSELIEHRKIIDHFRAKNESSYIFACQASVPLVFTPDLLYQLWNNFKQFQYDFEPGEFYKIPHIAVSDLLLSGLCKEVGFELFEIAKGIRDNLLEDLVLNLGEKRRNTIAAFLADYAQLEHRYANRKNLKSIHLLAAQSILDPAEMERQIIEYINLAGTDAEKINYLLLHNHLLPVGFESELSRISEGVQTAKKDELLSPILISENNPDAPGILNVKLPPALRSRIRKSGTTTSPLPEIETHSLAEQIIKKFIEEKRNALDLGNCGLTDADLLEGTAIDMALRSCTGLRSLTFSNGWYNFETREWISSANKGTKNKIDNVPPVIRSLANLELLRLSGESGDNGGISEISFFSNLFTLKYIDLSYNKISDISPLEKLDNLTHLLLGHNTLTDLRPLGKLMRLQALDLSNNLLVDLRPLLPLLVRPDNPIQVKTENFHVLAPNEISVNDNLLFLPPTEVVMQGNEAIIDYFAKLDKPNTAHEIEKGAYIKGYKYDIFISYSSLDNQSFNEGRGWVEEFYENLHLILEQRIGFQDAIKIWWDKNILPGENISFEVEEAIKQSAIMICLMSPGYLTSRYCQQQLQRFYTKAKDESVGLAVGDRSRIINVLLNNIPHTQWPVEINNTTGFPFYYSKGNGDLGDTLDVSSLEFRNSLRGLQKAIVNLIDGFSKINPTQITDPEKEFSVLIDTHFGDQEYAFELEKFFVGNGINCQINTQEDDPFKNANTLAGRLRGVSKIIFIYGNVSKEWVHKRMETTVQLIINNNYPAEELIVFMAPPHKDPDEISITNKFIPFRVINNSDSSQLNPNDLQSFLQQLKPLNLEPNAPIEITSQIQPFKNKWVLIAGTGNHKLSTEERLMSEAIASQCADKGYGIVGGGWPGVDEVVAECFTAQLKKNDLPEKGRLVQLLERGTKPKYELGTIERIASDSTWRADALNKSTAVILIGGLGGTYKIFKGAEKISLPVIPVPATGGDALEAYHALLNKSDLGYSQEQFIQLDKELNTAADADQIASTIVSILNEITGGIAQPLPHEEFPELEETASIGEEESPMLFYSSKEIMDMVNDSQQGSNSIDAAQLALLIFKTTSQRTWLVTTTRKLYILLDDDDTRRENKIIMTSFDKKKTLPLKFKEADGEGVVKFDAQSSWWYYSLSLYPNTTNLETSIKELIEF